mmetsp:Transcript_8088/g.21153  ORF Transcript_8088/g.21153 Transcript_8088/m.21153 type:complete len:92 (+) Transcript_8088:2-277(+)
MKRKANTPVLLQDLMPAIEKMAGINTESYDDVSLTIRELYDRLCISSRNADAEDLAASQQEGAEGWASSNHETERARVSKRLRPFHSPTRK